VGRSRAIIFDLDDTLYLEASYVSSGFRAVADWSANALGLDADEAFGELSALASRGVRGNTFDVWCRQRQIPTDADTIAQLVEIYRNHAPTLEPAADTVPVLTELRTTYALGLVSDGWLTVQQKKFRALGLEGFFDAVVFSDELGREHWKPSTRPFEAVLQQLEIVPPNAVYVADNPEKDFIGPRKLGMSTIRIKRPGGIYATTTATTPGAEAHFEMKALSGLTQLLPRIFGG